MSRPLLSRFGIGLFLLVSASLVWGGNPNPAYKVLNPISHGNLTIFPVVSSNEHDTSEFITLDEGIRSGEGVITAAAPVSALIRSPHNRSPVAAPQVNNLVLVNTSKHPPIRLA